MEPYACSHQGYYSEENEDSFLVLQQDEYCLLAVADGLGGHENGKLASSQAAERLAQNFFPQKIDREKIFHVLRQINDEVYQLSELKEKKPATTLSFAWVQQNELFLGHVGDSRVYIYAEDKLNLLTQDQCAIEEMILQGIWVPERYKKKYSHILARSLGTREQFFLPDDPFSYVLGPFSLPQNGWLLLATDGLNKHLTDMELEQFFHRYGEKNAQELADILLERALLLGGRDNITIILKKIEGGK